MDLIDRLAWLFSGMKTQSPPPTNEMERERIVVSTPEQNKIDNKVNAIIFENTFNVDIKGYTVKNKEDNQNNKINLEHVIAGNELRLSDVVHKKANHKSYNETIKKHTPEGGYLTINSAKHTRVEELMPFTKQKTSLSNWIYTHKIELISTMSVYIIILLSLMFSTVEVNNFNSPDGILIDFPHEDIKIKEPEIEKIQHVDEKVKNYLIDESEELNSSLQDDRNTQSQAAKIYEDANKIQQDLIENRANYKNGLEQVADIRNKHEQEASKNIKNDNSEATTKDKNVSTEGNVTVSYQLNGRYVTRPEIPAYRCKGGGKVVVKISVDREGIVVSSSIQSMTHVTDECLPRMALQAAKETIFNIDQTAKKRQVGHITFMFVAQ